MRKIYRIHHLTNQYQYVLPIDLEQISSLVALCQSWKEAWYPPSVFIYEPFLKKGDFYQSNGSCLIVNSTALKLLKGFFLDAGEILPLHYKEDSFSFINILRCYDCLDKDNTEWMTGLKGFIPEKYVFKRQFLPETGLFKIPETHAGEILIHVNNNKPVEDDFTYVVKYNNLEGIDFELLWESEEV